MWNVNIKIVMEYHRMMIFVVHFNILHYIRSKFQTVGILNMFQMIRISKSVNGHIGRVIYFRFCFLPTTCVYPECLQQGFTVMATRNHV